ncbi:hypothetical protein SDRG_06392 [Saprolegnia diclina VS20]|uniref:Low temperature requirement protein LtrA n=1 Tax=Saprolegnia diclina (strain VS20) TaxID=1156394 RepID=T0S0N5_SAPDV|nr:hypothetical protein SDRG_06392 [Saprolegnia diclina VS20]EQC36287.1 hypothetical protein SDRG_06392 [Saprolegnia diclina VS20]|eukprot:XP_008610393.1 hypothetical protein SDRG_06392 [Saprolegnia diclina VS20]
MELRTFRSRPRLSADWSGEYEEKSSEWFELFLDLVLVAACANVAEKLKDEFTLNGFISFTLMTSLYVTSWHWYAHFHGRFSESSLAHYAMLFILLGGLGTMVLASEPGWHFSIGLLFVRIALLAMNAAVYRVLPASRDRLRVDMTILACSCAVLLLAIARPMCSSNAYMVVLVLEIVVLYVSRMRHWCVAPGDGIPVNVEHMNDREGSLVLVALGEAVVSAVINSRHVSSPLPNRFYVMMLLSMLVNFALALFYFAVKPPRTMHAVHQSVRRASLFTLLHVLLLPTILALGVSMKFIAEAVLRNEKLDVAVVWLLFGAMALCMVWIFLLRGLHYWGAQPATTDRPNVKRIIRGWWALMVGWPLLPLASGQVLMVMAPRGVDPLIALGAAAACVLFWIFSETAIMNYLAVLSETTGLRTPELSPLVLRVNSSRNVMN